MQEPTLFDLPTIPYSDSDTSLEQAKKLLKKAKSECDEEMLYLWLVLRGSYGATDEEIQREFKWTGDYQRPRRWRLCKDGRVEWLGAKRANSNGNQMKVWSANFHRVHIKSTVLQ